MELQLNVNVRYSARRSESVEDVLRHFESPAWVRLVLRQVLPQLRQISPTDPTALTEMVRDARPTDEQETSCAICMTGAPTTGAASTSSTAVTPLELPCGHRFHCGCARSWLSRRSTCPLCRFQLPKAYTGTFAIAAVRSMLLLSPEHDKLVPSELMSTRADSQTLQAAVKITMTRISFKDAKRKRPCQVSVAMTHADGSSAAVPHSGQVKRRREEKTPDTPDAVRHVFKQCIRTSYPL